MANIPSVEEQRNMLLQLAKNLMDYANDPVEFKHQVEIGQLIIKRVEEVR